jgi:hypothetical protein
MVVIVVVALVVAVVTGELLAVVDVENVKVVPVGVVVVEVITFPTQGLRMLRVHLVCLPGLKTSGVRGEVCWSVGVGWSWLYADTMGLVNCGTLSDGESHGYFVNM